MSGKSLFAGALGFVLVVFQVVSEYTQLVPWARDASFILAGVAFMIAIVWWVATVELTRRIRLIAGVAASLLAIALTVFFLERAWEWHGILVTEARDGTHTTTSPSRGADERRRHD